MPDLLRVAICQINTRVGDIGGNVGRCLAALARAEAADADVAVLPELAVTGYPPEDLALRPGFAASSRAALLSFAAATRRCAALVGFVDGSGETAREAVDMAGVGVFSSACNALAVCAAGRVHGVYRKRCLPNYDVFDEVRQFSPGGADSPALFRIAGVAVGVTVCEDAWVPDGPLESLATDGARLALNASSSPFRVGKQAAREDWMRRRAVDAGIPVVYANLVGGQDDLVFDGGSFAVDADGSVIVRCASFAESVDVFDLELPSRRPVTGAVVDVPVGGGAPGGEGGSRRRRLAGPLVEPLGPNAERWSALLLATSDYVRKSGFSDVAIGMSGGVDSSLVAAVAVDALGAEHVHGILMPSRYSSSHSLADAAELSANLGISALEIGIDPAHRVLSEMIAKTLDHSGGAGGAGCAGELEAGGVTDQNLQARVRGVLLMALANEHGWLVLTTGNKSEQAVGYSTLYGDTAGAYAVISDLWKTEVYELCRWRNRRAGRELIPRGVLEKAPSAELAPGQRDDQSLPAYEVLDPILRLHVEELLDAPEIQSLGVAPSDVVARVCRMVGAAEYKRRQSPLGPRLTKRAFGRDRRMPIVNSYGRR